MSDIELVKPHSLSIATAKARAQNAIDELADEYDLDSEWHGNTLHVYRTGVDGQIHVTNAEIQVRVTLGFLLKPLKAKFVDQIERSFEKWVPEPARKAAHERGLAGHKP
ncbi:MAG: polyhydroxyalkanoic acid system family protein [Bryobacteraceae bacterium]|jgi:putative polyhydroxyalkanoate system protein